MCRAFSCVITKNNKVLWKAGVNSHDALIDDANLKDDTTDGDLIKFAKIEITPDKGYLHPEDKWTLRVDENTTPRWLTKAKKDLCWIAFGEWKKQIYSGINLDEAINPVYPLKIKSAKVTEEDKELLKKWASVRDSVWASVRDSVWDSVRDSVWASVWASVRDSVWDSVWASVKASVWASVKDSVWASVKDSVWASVWAYTGSLFTSITEWQYAPKSDGYPYQPCVDLWKRGFVPSFDGTTWRLHSGKDAKIVYEWTPEKEGK
jgi:hypothetical protein